MYQASVQTEELPVNKRTRDNLLLILAVLLMTLGIISALYYGG